MTPEFWESMREAVKLVFEEWQLADRSPKVLADIVKVAKQIPAPGQELPSGSDAELIAELEDSDD